jgi:hypothetical protein
MADGDYMAAMEQVCVLVECVRVLRVVMEVRAGCCPPAVS